MGKSHCSNRVPFIKTTTYPSAAAGVKRSIHRDVGSFPYERSHHGNKPPFLNDQGGVSVKPASPYRASSSARAQGPSQALRYHDGEPFLTCRPLWRTAPGKRTAALVFAEAIAQARSIGSQATVRA